MKKFLPDLPFSHNSHRHFSSITCARPIVLSLILLLNLYSAALADEEKRPPRWAEPVTLPEAENFYRVTPNLYRSAQPSVKAFREYEKFGIKTVINLRAQHSDRQLMPHGSSMTLIEYPINTWGLDEEDVIIVLRHIQTQPGPILVHCQHGADRTGTIIAMYRIVMEGWSETEALAEMTNGGYGFHSIWRNLPNYIKKADIAKVKQALAAEPDGRK